MTNPTAVANVESMRTELAQAKQRETELHREASYLPNRIKEAARQVVREKASAARVGGALLAVAAESEVSELEQRRKNIDYEIWAAKLYRAETAKRLHELEEQAADLEIPDAENKHRAAQTALEAATAEERRTYAAYFAALGKRDEARRVKKVAEREIAEREARYPGVE